VRRAAHVGGVVLIAFGLLLMAGLFERGDRQHSTSAGSVESASVRKVYAPGWGLLSVVSGGVLIALSARGRK
jgi:hypothetical protein